MIINKNELIKNNYTDYNTSFYYKNDTISHY